jgi:DNA-binding response OmpR family regulator
LTANAFSRSAFLNTSKPLGKASILLIEDDPVVAEDLHNLLTSEGYRVVSRYRSLFANPKHFFDQIDQIVTSEGISLVLTDINLNPEFDGIDIARHTRRKWRLPVIYISGQAQADTVIRARKTRPGAYLLKPFRTADLLAKIKSVLGAEPVTPMPQKISYDD